MKTEQQKKYPEEDRLLRWRGAALAVALSLALCFMLILAGGRRGPSQPTSLYKSMSKEGFTLIELSIVLVIIGLIVGGVLVGQDLIRAATVRAQITQVEKYNTAVNTFRDKYGGLPGDITPVAATQFGFYVGTGCNGSPAMRDGNGLLDSDGNSAEFNTSLLQLDEPALFWSDLSAAGLIEGSFTLANCTAFAPTLAQTALLMPPAKIASGSFVYIYDYKSLNFFGISTITGWYGYETSSPSFTVAQAYAVDKKMDDGIPITGHVLANFVTGGGVCPGSLSGDTCTSANTTASGGTSGSCYDTTTNTYSVGISGGSNVNCALSFQFQ